MAPLEIPDSARLREMIMERASRMSLQITEAAEEIGRRAAEKRLRTHEIGDRMPDLPAHKGPLD